MVTMLEVNREALRELFDNDLLKAYRFVVRYGNTKLTVSKKQVKKLKILILQKANFTPKQIRAAIDASFYSSKNTNHKFSSSFINAVYALNDIKKIEEKADDYTAIPIPISKAIVERLIIEDLTLAGFTIKQIAFATGFDHGKIKRKYKELT